MLFTSLTQVLGIGVVLHRSDYGGCQKVLDSLAAKKRKRKSRVILTITPRDFVITSKKNGQLMLVLKMEDVYVCHPHSSNKRLFGFIGESWESRRKHCYCFSTFRTDNVTGTDVLQAYNEACRLWMMQSQSSQEKSEEQEEDDTDDERKNHGLEKSEKESSTSDTSPGERGSTKQAHPRLKTRKDSQMQRRTPDSKSSIQQAACSSKRVSFESFMQRHGGISGMHTCSCGSVPLKGAHTSTGSSNWVKVMPHVSDRVGGGRMMQLRREGRKGEKRRRELKEKTIKVRYRVTVTNRNETVGAGKEVDSMEGTETAGRDIRTNHRETTYREKSMNSAKLQKPAKTKEATKPTAAEANHRAPRLAPRNFPPPPPPIHRLRAHPSPARATNILHRFSSPPPPLLGSRSQSNPELNSAFSRLFQEQVPMYHFLIAGHEATASALYI